MTTRLGLKRTLMLAVATSCLTVGSTLPASATPTESDATARSVADQVSLSYPSAHEIEFNFSIKHFLKVRRKRVGPYNWHSDGCSGPINDFPGRTDFINGYFNDQCKRHDFGYRNHGRIHRPKVHKRKAIDSRLHLDMDNRCDKFSRADPRRGYCFVTSDLVYKAVREHGGKYWE